MTSVHRFLFPALWLAWALYWAAMARNVRATARREPLASRLLHVVPLALAVFLLWPRHLHLPVLDDFVAGWTPLQFWLGAVVAATGFVLTVWARGHLGRNWSGTVTVKQGHELVTTGPYAFVRHPIYTGLLLALLGAALAQGRWSGALAVVVAFAALWRKLRLEERWMREQFGQRYAAYARRVPALVPRLRR